MSERGRDPAGTDDALEPERYELREPPVWRRPLGRRALFRALGGGLAVVSLVERPAAGQESGGGRRGGGGGGVGRGQPATAELGAWLHIAEDGAVTVFTGKAEVGQDIRTALTQVVVEELPAPLASVRLVMADTALVPFDAGTFGSRTTPAMAPQLRRAAAAARELLVDLAAERLKVDRAALAIADGKVTHAPSGRSLGFGELTAGKKLVKTVSDKVPTTPASRWKVAGQPLAKVDGRAVVTGERRFTSDLERPGMLVGKVLRPPAAGARLAGLGARRLGAVKGARLVREGEGEAAFVGVVAPDEHAAGRALAALEPSWKPPAERGPSSAQLFARFREAAAGKPAAAAGGRADGERGDVAAALAAARHKLERSYTNAYIAHAPLEPRAAVAELAPDGGLTVWTGTQRPFGVRRELCDALGLPEEKVRVIVPDTGAGYGGKHTGEAAVEAARLARAAGKPVKLVWTREEEFRFAYFRPAGLMEIKSAVADDGRVTAWEAHNHNAGGSGLRTPYDVPNQKHVFHQAPSPLRQGSYRALASTANGFAREVQMDEMAALVKMDPLAFRLKNLTDARLRAVLTAAAERFRWDAGPAADGAAFGLACGAEKGGHVATCVEIDGREAAAGTIRVVRAVTAFECGAVVNPDRLRSQVEGCVIMGLGGALFEAIDFADGRILNARFANYRVPRFGDLPRMDTVLVDRKDLPSAGAGETPIMAIAPAIANAVAAATGRRLRDLPLKLRA